MATSDIEDRLLDLLVRWELLRCQGTEVTAEELCSDCPELRGELEARIEALRAIEPVLEAVEAAPPSTHGDPRSEGDEDREIPEFMRASATYRPQRRHAHGGVGEVLAARQEELGRMVAIKRIRPERLHHAARKRFLREAEITAVLQHPGVVPIYALGQDDAGPFYTMPLIEGQTLQQAIGAFHGDQSLTRGSGQRSLRFRELLRKLTTVCDTVAYAHDQGVVHRDLKPSNIMLGRYGETLVMDWGLAKHFEAENPAGEHEVEAPSPSDWSEGLTATGAVMGTPQYMSPEQARGLPAGPASDVFNLGLILYAVLSGTPAFEAASLRGPDPLKAVRDATVRPPRERDPELPKALDAICLKALAVNPEDRYDSARDLGKDLENWMADEPVTAWQEPFLSRLGRLIRRRRTLVVSAAAVLVFGMVAIVGFMIVLTGMNRVLRVSYIAEAEQRRAAQLNSAKVLLTQSVAACESGEITRGMLWLARALEVTPPEDRGTLGSTIRANLAGVTQQLRPLRAFLAHPEATTAEPDWVVCSAAFSPDGATILTGGTNGTAQFWNAVDGKPIGRPLEHPGSVQAVAFSRVGRLAVTGSKDAARLWNAATAEPRGTPIPQPSSVLAAAFASDGTCFVTVGADRNIRRWDTETAKLLSIIPIRKGLELNRAAFGGDTEFLLTSDSDNAVSVWSVATGRQIGESIRHEYQVTALGFSPDGRKLVTGDLSGTARIWGAIGSKQIGAPMKHLGTIWSVGFSPDGRKVLTGADDRTARLWNASTGELLEAPLELQATVGAVGYNTNGAIVIAGQYGLIRLYGPPENHAAVRTLAHGTDWVAAVAFTPDGKIILTAGGNPNPIARSQGFVRLWDRFTGQALGDPVPYDHPVLAVAFNPDGTKVLTGCGYPYRNIGGAYLRSLDPGDSSIIKFKHDYNPVWSVAFSPDGRTVATAGFDPKSHEGDAKLWAVDAGRCLQVIRHPRGGVLAVAFSPDGKTVLTGGFDCTTRFWEVSTGQPLGPILKNNKEVFGVAFSPDGRTVLTGSMDGTTRLWDRATGAQRGKVRQHEGWVRALAFSPDGKAILTGGMDNRARLWQLTSGEAVTGLQFGPPVQHDHWVLAGAFSPDGGSILTGSSDTTARVRDLPRPVEGDPHTVTLWVQVITGMTLDDGDVVRSLGVDEWNRCRDLLKTTDLRRSPAF